ncbi:hypothetical protein C2G38_2059917 [Gigaspora rosea]|uniref:Membrane anchor Opy2 N-terminal domain-containing protein n=1 Tax=Gigaspora rosea TaxID=44941 RepID=A0A397W3U7_9GLOM|nr:hypothetical protein C2G38_2059917 [Gigaspora rosea]
MMVRERDFLMFLVIALLPAIRTGCQPCPPCRGTVVRRISCEFACPVCYY